MAELEELTPEIIETVRSKVQEKGYILSKVVAQRYRRYGQVSENGITGFQSVTFWMKYKGRDLAVRLDFNDEILKNLDEYRDVFNEHVNQTALEIIDAIKKFESKRRDKSGSEGSIK